MDSITHTTRIISYQGCSITVIQYIFSLQIYHILSGFKYRSTRKYICCICNTIPKAVAFILLQGFLCNFLWIVISCLCVSSTQKFSTFPVEAITCERSGSADAWIVIQRFSCWVFCVQSCLESAFSRMAPKGELGRWRHFFPQWGTNSNTHDNDTNCWPTVPTVHRFTGGPW